MDLGIGGKVALVCASSKGLGYAVAEGLSFEGVRVAMCARNEGPLMEAAQQIRSRTGVETLAVRADVTKNDEVEGLLRSVAASLGPIDILVNNAGGPPSGSFETHGDDEWVRAVNLNFLSAVRLCRRIVPQMKKRRSGRIINITSIAVKQPVDGLILSNAARAGLTGFAKSLATELGPYNILVNNVCPGYTKTERLEEIVLSQSRSTGKPVQDVYQTWEKQIPLGRVADPREFASLVVFLASERASYITGTTIQVDGGYCRGLL